MRPVLALLTLSMLLSAPAPPPAALLVAPLPGPLIVLSAFEAPPTPYAAGHRGVDLAAAVGAEVRAVGAGVVIYAGPLVDRGVVSVENAGLRTSYEPVTAAVVRGQRVVAGQLLGTLQAAHLHWGVRVNGEYVDPMTLLAPLHVRLLPWAG